MKKWQKGVYVSFISRINNTKNRHIYNTNITKILQLC